MDGYATNAKSSRVLYLQSQFLNGEIVNKAKTAQDFGVSVRSIQRDIEDLRYFFSQQTPPRDIVYDSKNQTYSLTASQDQLTNNEILAVCKILLDSRSLLRSEMASILDKLIGGCVPDKNKKAVLSLIANENKHYIQPQHGTSILDRLWDIGQAIQNQRVINITYKKLGSDEPVVRRVEPVGIMFSEYYFYLTAFIKDIDKKEHFDNADDLFPTIYRIDRICALTLLSENFKVPYKDRFQEGEFRKRVQFMYGGRLQTVRFTYRGPSIEAVLDRLPTAQVIAELDGTYTVSAEVFGHGIDMWLRSQGDYVAVL